MAIESHKAWWTADELHFVRRIAEKKDRAAFDGYVASIERRKDWGRIDRVEVLAELAVQNTRMAMGAP